MRMSCARFRPARWQRILRMWKPLSAGRNVKDIICRNTFPALLVLNRSGAVLKQKFSGISGGFWRAWNCFVAPKWDILCIALEGKEVSEMAQYVVDMQTEKQEKFYFIREKESMDIVLLPSKYLMHKKRSKISPNTIRRSAFALSYYLNYMDENQLHLDDIYKMEICRTA